MAPYLESRSHDVIMQSSPAKPHDVSTEDSAVDDGGQQQNGADAERGAESQNAPGNGDIRQLTAPKIHGDGDGAHEPGVNGAILDGNGRA